MGVPAEVASADAIAGTGSALRAQGRPSQPHHWPAEPPCLHRAQAGRPQALQVDCYSLDLTTCAHIPRRVSFFLRLLAMHECDSLRELNLASNKLRGDVPECLNLCTKLRELVSGGEQTTRAPTLCMSCGTPRPVRAPLPHGQAGNRSPSP